MKLCTIDPVTDPRWSYLVESHPDGAIFHTKGWLEALHRTYRYQPVAYAIEEADRLVSAIPFCKVNSFITGSRLVSLPFSDHCQPLIDSSDHLTELISAVANDARRERLKYLEIRPLSRCETGLTSSDSLVVHNLDISRSEDELLASFHADCIRRKIAKSERQHLQCEEGRTEDLLQKFYTLLVVTRRKHGIPPQPLEWFHNLIDCCGEMLKIFVASKDDTPIASIITLSFKKTIVYKYGCSEPAYNALGGTIFLLWRTIQRAKNEGLTALDLGRSDYSTPGLITFKDRWGASRIKVNYYRSGTVSRRSTESRLAIAAKRLLSSVPDPMFSALGGMLYRHVG
jgi:CelD/BcsL family acetyltransferase involved in cellulose biosynthesis